MHARRSARTKPLVIEGEAVPVAPVGGSAPRTAPCVEPARMPTNDNRPVPDAVFLCRAHRPDLVFQRSARGRAQAPEATLETHSAGLREAPAKAQASVALLVACIAALAASSAPGLSVPGPSAVDRTAIRRSTHGVSSATTVRTFEPPHGGKTDRITVTR